ncbi:STAS domain-containing protein [Marinobacter halotolerans]|uniref:STAS domain-containing protein n=1 Tax=Marinobacter halotolerans TaxID=1569211 RepID=UPI001785FAEB|nr:STAS domain-containing protein [Marinobacter halotolerans]
MSAFIDFSAETGCLAVHGELTIYQANTASEYLCKAFGSGELRHVDLAGVTELDTAGLQILLLARSLRTPANVPVSLVNPSDAVRDVMELAGLEQTQ